LLRKEKTHCLLIVKGQAMGGVFGSGHTPPLVFSYLIPHSPGCEGSAAVRLQLYQTLAKL